ncbi:hypothetical protein KKC65_02315 [Patescibacteria group bacterium]|nr:hypothetical protein [Patescibacteria group bacterium]
MHKRKERHSGAIKRLKRLKIWAGLTLDNLYEMFAIATNENIKTQIENRILEIASGDDDLFSIIRDEKNSSLGRKAWEKLQNRIKKDFLKKSYARKIVFKIFKYVIDLRRESWKIFKVLDPTIEELQEALDLDCMKSMPDIMHEAEKLIRKKHRKKKTFNAEKTIRKIIELS